MGSGIASPPPMYTCPGKSCCTSTNSVGLGHCLALEPDDVEVDLFATRRQRGQLGALLPRAPDQLGQVTRAHRRRRGPRS